MTSCWPQELRMTHHIRKRLRPMTTGLPTCVRHRARRFPAPIRHHFSVLRVVGRVVVRVEPGVPFTTL